MRLLVFSSMQKNKLRVKLDKLEDSRKKLVSELNTFDEKVLKFKPAPGKWSITQILYHLDFAESGSIRYVKKKMLGGDALKSTGIIAATRFFFLKWLLHSGYKWKAPKALGDVPEDVKYAEVIHRWNETRDHLRMLIDSIPEQLVGKEVYRHPRAGRLNLLHMIEFFQDHFDHHLMQINSLKGSAH